MVYQTILFVGIFYFIPFIYGAIINFEIMFGAKSIVNFGGVSISDNLYAFFSFLSSLLCHIIVPIVIALELKKNRYSNKLSKKQMQNTIICYFLVILSYFVWVLILTTTKLIDGGPYPFLNFGNYKNLPQDIEFFFFDVAIGIFYILISYLILKYSNQ